MTLIKAKYDIAHKIEKLKKVKLQPGVIEQLK